MDKILPPEGSDTGSNPVSNTNKKWVNIVKKIGMYLSFGLILIIGVSFIFFGNQNNKKELKFKENAGVVTARIYQNTISDYKQVLYIKYYVNGEEYDGVISSYKKNKYGSKVKIYYDKENPTTYTIGNISYVGYMFIFLGIVLIIMSCSFIIRMFIYEE